MNALASAHEPMQALQMLCEGLTWPSEADYPVEVVHWQRTPQTSQDILDWVEHHSEAEIESVSPAHLFRKVVRVQDWFGKAELDRAQRFQKIQKLLCELENPQAYRIGEVEVTVYVVSQLPDGTGLGIKAQLVET